MVDQLKRAAWYQKSIMPLSSIVIRDSIPAIPDKCEKRILIDAKERYGFSFTNEMRLTG